MKAIQCVTIFLISALLFASCKKFLDKTPAATVSDREIFGTYRSFQGFVDPNYGEIRNYNTTYTNTTMNIAGETINQSISWSMAYCIWTGDYVYIAGMDDYSYNDGASLFADRRNGFDLYLSSGIWTGGWRGIRRFQCCPPEILLVI